MTFDEALNKLEPRTIWSGEMRDLLELRKEYAPTIEMTKHEKKYLLHYLNNSSFYSLIADIFSLETDDFENLSDEDLMQAWLHPETIKIVKGAKR